jgi:hypothetical protein
MRRSNNFANRNTTLQPITPRSNHVTPDTLAPALLSHLCIWRGRVRGGGEDDDGGYWQISVGGGGGTAAVPDGGLVPVMLAEPDNEG